MFDFFGRKRKDSDAKDVAQSLRMEESQAALLTAAVTTAEAAQDVTAGLKRRLDDVVKQFEGTARILRDSLILCREDGSITTFNPAAERLFNIKAGVALKKNVMDFFDSAQDTVTDIGSLWAILQNDDQDDVLGVRDGQTFPVRVTFSVLSRHDDSRVILLLIHETLSVPVERKFQSVFESSMDGIVVVMNEDGTMMAINPAIGKMFGYNPVELTNMKLFDLVVNRDRQRVIDCCSSKKMMSHHFAAEGVHSSGRIINLIITRTDIEWDGHRAILATIKDVTEIRKIESLVSLKQDNGIDMLCTFDPTYRITFANQTFADHVGVRRKELVGCDFRDFLTALDLASFIIGIGNLSLTAPTRRSMTTSKGRTYDWVDSMTCDESGRALEYQRTGRDVTDIFAATPKNRTSIPTHE